MRAGLAIVGFILLFIIVFAIVIGGDDPDPATQPLPPRVLTEVTESNTLVRYVQDGKINAEELHRSIRITVDKNSRTIDVVQGYNNTVIKSTTLPNTEAAFRAFIASLGTAGFNQERENVPESQKSPEGQCPNGRRYLYEIDNSKEDKSLWSDTCDSRQGTFAGNASTVRTLFTNQIPGYSDFVQGVTL